MTLSACLIARNERHNVEGCLSSFADHVDELVFVDTGSRDGTVSEVRRVCREHGWTDKLVLGRFRWCDDFAAARNHAHSIATGDVHFWIDLDDRLEGAEHLSELAEQFSDPELGQIQTRYMLLIPADRRRAIGDWTQFMWRGSVRWSGRTWEQPDITGGIRVSDKVRKWHCRSVSHGDRDILIARRWHHDEPGARRPLRTLIAALEDQARYDDEMLELVNELLEMPLDRQQRTEALIWRATVNYEQNRAEEAERDAETAVGLSPEHGPGWTILAGCALRRDEFAVAEIYAGRAIETPVNSRTALQAGLFLALAQGAQGRYTTACRTAEDILQHMPAAHQAHVVLSKWLRRWRRLACDDQPLATAVLARAGDE